MQEEMSRWAMTGRHRHGHNQKSRSQEENYNYITMRSLPGFCLHLVCSLPLESCCWLAGDDDGSGMPMHAAEKSELSS